MACAVMCGPGCEHGGSAGIDGGGGDTGAGGTTGPGGTAGPGGPSFDVSPFVGIWKGKTQPQNRDVIFQITEAGTIAGFEATISFSLAGGTCTAPFTAFAVERLTGPSIDFPISYWASDLVPTVHLVAAGDTFTGTISASDGGLVACGSTLTVGTGIGTTRQTFSATKCAGCAVPSCDFQNDGACDEPGGGTGLCFLGTDPVDCGGGTGGAGGATGTGGSTGVACAPAGSENVTDFSDWNPNTQRFGSAGRIEGTVAGFGALGGQLTATVDTAAQNVHATGSLTLEPGSTFAIAGVVIAFNACVDASLYGGVQIDLEGSLGGASASLAIGSSAYSCSGCYPPNAPITGTGAITVRWSDLLGGSPAKPIDPRNIDSVQLVLTAQANTSVDFRIDDVKFVSK
jgi:hypothetical protein